jgi:glycosyltransferase 2 family protein
MNVRFLILVSSINKNNFSLNYGMARFPVKFFLRLTLGLMLIILLFLFVSPSAVIDSIESINPVFLIAAILVYALAFLVVTLRWRIIVAHLGVQIPLGLAYQAFVGGVLYSDFTPGRIGDLTRAVLVKDQMDLHKATVSVIVDRFIDILVLTTLGIVAVIVYSSRFASILPQIALVVLIVIFLSAIILFWQNSLFFSWIQKIPYFGIPTFVAQVQTALAEFRDARKIFAEGILLTVLVWFIHALRVVLIAFGMGYILPAPELFFILPLISALSIVPITLSGLGLVEGGMMAMLVGYGVPVSAALSIAILDRGLTMFFHFAVGGWYALKKIVS